jgi:histidine ammonia-lyase
VTLAGAVLAHQDLAALLDAELQVAALSHLAVSGSAQPYAELVQTARPHPGQAATARSLRELLGADADAPGARVQDPYGLRALPQVHGPAVDALGQLERVLATELNAAAENPLVDLAGLRMLAAPASLGTAVLSRGAEEHAAFSPQAARAAAAMVPRLRTMLACELVAAVRGLRQRAVAPSGAQLRAVYDQCREQLPADDEDHPLDIDVAAAEQIIADLAKEREG